MLSRVKRLGPAALILFVLIFLTIYFLAGWQHPIRIWDEAIYANNALEMQQSGNLLVLTNNGKPTLYNTKPPLAIWIQSLSISLFGINEFAIRLPSFIATFLSLVFIIKFLLKYTESVLSALLVLLVLLTATGYLGDHVTATGDLDAINSFWIVLFLLACFQMTLHSEPNAKKWLWLAGGFFFCAFLTKSTTVFLMLPGTALCVIIYRRWKMLTSLQFIIVVCSILGLIVTYYILLDRLNPGYAEKVWFSEIQRFFIPVMFWHNQPFWFYVENFSRFFSPWCYIFIPCMAIGLQSANPVRKKIVALSSICSLCFLILISMPKNKLEWYPAPIYPLMGVIVGIGLCETLEALKRKSKPIFLISTVLLLGYFGVLLYSTIEKRKQITLDPLEREGTFLKAAVEHGNGNKLKILMITEHPEHVDQLNFYRKKFFIEKDLSTTLITSCNDLAKGDTVMACQQAQIECILNTFNTDTIFENRGCLILKIIRNR